jgi:hypothetical protein
MNYEVVNKKDQELISQGKDWGLKSQGTNQSTRPRMNVLRQKLRVKSQGVTPPFWNIRGTQT